MQPFKLNEAKYLSLIDAHPQLAVYELKPLVEKYFRIGQLNWLIGLAYYRTGNYDRCIKHLETAIYELIDKPEAYWYLCLAYGRAGKWKSIEKYADKYPEKAGSVNLVYEISLIKRGKQKRVKPVAESHFVNNDYHYRSITELLAVLIENDISVTSILKLTDTYFEHSIKILHKIAFAYYQIGKFELSYSLYRYSYDKNNSVESTIGMLRCLVWDKDRNEEFNQLKASLYNKEHRDAEDIDNIVAYHILEDPHYVSGTTSTILLNMETGFEDFIRNYTTCIVNEHRIVPEMLHSFFEENNYPGRYLKISELLSNISREEIGYEEALAEIEKISRGGAEKIYLLFFTEVILKKPETIDTFFEGLMNCCQKEIDFAVLYHLCHRLKEQEELFVLINRWKETFPQSVSLKIQCMGMYSYGIINYGESYVLLDAVKKSIENSNLVNVSEFYKVFICESLYLVFNNNQFKSGLDYIMGLEEAIRLDDDILLYEALFLYNLNKVEECVRILSGISLLKVKNRSIIGAVNHLDECPPRLKEQILNYEIYKIYRFYNVKTIPKMLADIADSDKYMSFYRIGQFIKIKESANVSLSIKEQYEQIEYKLRNWKNVDFVNAGMFDNEQEFCACIISNFYLGDFSVPLIILESLHAHFRHDIIFQSLQSFYYIVLLDQLNVSGINYSNSTKKSLIEIQDDVSSYNFIDKYYYAKTLTLLNEPKAALQFLMAEENPPDYIRYLKVEIFDLLIEKELLTENELHDFSLRLLPVKFSLLQSKEDVIYKFLKEGAVIKARKDPALFLKDIQPLLFILEMSETFSRYLSPNTEFFDEFINCIEFEGSEDNAKGISVPKAYFKTVEMLFPDKWSGDVFSRYENMIQTDVNMFFKKLHSNIEKEARGCLHAYQHRKELEYIDFNGYLETIIRSSEYLTDEKDVLLKHYLYLLYCVLMVSNKNPVAYYQRFILHSTKAVLDQVISGLFDMTLFSNSYTLVQLILLLVNKNKDDIMSYEVFVSNLKAVRQV